MASVGRVTEITSQSANSFEDAMKAGVARANKSLRNVTGAWVKDQSLAIEDGQIVAYQVNLQVTFVLDDED